MEGKVVNSAIFLGPSDELNNIVKRLLNKTLFVGWGDHVPSPDALGGGEKIQEYISKYKAIHIAQLHLLHSQCRNASLIYQSKATTKIITINSHG